MPAWINKASICILAWCIYDFQGLLLPKGTIFSQLLLIVLILVSLYYMFIANTRYHLPKYFWGLNVLIFMFTIYGVYLMIGYNPYDYSKQVGSSSYLKGIYISLLPIYSFYVFSKEGLINQKFLSICFFILLGLTVANYFEHQKELLYAAMLKGTSAEEFTNNVGYDFLALIPFCVFFHKKPILQYIALAVCMTFVFMAMKRGAVVIGVLSVIWFMWCNIRDSSVKKKIGVLTLSMFLCFVGYQFVERQMQKSLYFQKRVEITLEGNSSGRDIIYARLADYFWNEATPLQFVIGAGANATLKVARSYAHNDWLEIAVNQGMLGIFIYIFYWIMFAKNVASNFFNPQEKLILQLLFLAFFVQALFSMSYGSMGFVPMLSLGFILAQEKKYGKVAYSNQTFKE